MTPPHEPPPRAGTGTGRLTGRLIVLLEDDDLVRRTTERVLRRFGAEVVSGSRSAHVGPTLAGRDPAPICVTADYWLNRQEGGLTATAAVCEGCRRAVGRFDPDRRPIRRDCRDGRRSGFPVAAQAGLRRFLPRRASQKRLNNSAGSSGRAGQESKKKQLSVVNSEGQFGFELGNSQGLCAKLAQ